MVTTPLRLPREMFEQLKANARREGKRHTVGIREIRESSGGLGVARNRLAQP